VEAVFAVILLALLEYSVLGALVGRARMKHGIQAPATTGSAEFERTFRVHQNTLESLIVFVPGIYIFGLYANPYWAAALGIVFIVGRAMYARAYIADAAKRGPGAIVSYAVNGVLIFGGLLSLGLSLL
jgi:uncharacterized membrane protein YecN with MAPEG domain